MQEPKNRLLCSFRVLLQKSDRLESTHISPLLLHRRAIDRASPLLTSHIAEELRLIICCQIRQADLIGRSHGGKLIAPVRSRLAAVLPSYLSESD